MFFCCEHVEHYFWSPKAKDCLGENQFYPMELIVLFKNINNADFLEAWYH